jgi:transcription elongation factor Elf1
VGFDPRSHDDDEGEPEGAGRRFGDFDCPVCNANNPYDDAFGEGDEIRCYYCGQAFAVSVSDSGKLKLREI